MQSVSPLIKVGLQLGRLNLCLKKGHLETPKGHMETV